MNTNDPENLHGHEAAPGPDGRIPSSTGWPDVSIKTPGPEMHDPLASAAERKPDHATARRPPDDFPVIDRDDRSESESDES